MKILTFQPLVFQPGDERFLVTNLGAIAKALEKEGHEVVQVAYSPGQQGKQEGVLLCTPQMAEAPSFWKELEPWAVITNMWGAPRYQKIREAILASTPRLVDRMDTDGNRSPRTDLPIYLHAMWSRIQDMRNKPVRRFLSPLVPLAHAAAHLSFPKILDERQAAVLDTIPVVTAESPMAVERMVRFQRDFGFEGKNIHFSPFPVNEENLGDIPQCSEKKNLIVSVGRWDAHQKNFPMMLKVVSRFLEENRDWEVVIPGKRPYNWMQDLSKLGGKRKESIQITGPLPHAQIYEAVRSAKIFLMTSRHESFGIAAAEALCLGASVVGPAHIPSVPWFCGSDSGTVSTLYTKNGMLDALSAEARAWQEGHRNPRKISETWRSRTGETAVAKHLLELLEGIPGKRHL